MRNHDAHEFWPVPPAVLAREFINVGLALVRRTTSLVGMIEDVKVITSSVIPGKNIGDWFQNRGFSDTCLSHKENGVWRFHVVL